MSQANDLGYVKDQLQQKKITLAEANVLLVRLEGFRVIAGPTPREVRTALNAAVRAGQLGHFKKDGMRPEVYFHPNSRAAAEDARVKAFNRGLDALQAICI